MGARVAAGEGAGRGAGGGRARAAASGGGRGDAGRLRARGDGACGGSACPEPEEAGGGGGRAERRGCRGGGAPGWPWERGVGRAAWAGDVPPRSPSCDPARQPRPGCLATLGTYRTRSRPRSTSQPAHLTGTEPKPGKTNDSPRGTHRADRSASGLVPAAAAGPGRAGPGPGSPRPTELSGAGGKQATCP